MTKIFIIDGSARFLIPTDFSSLALWFTAKDTNSVILSGSNGQQWRDKSQFNRHISAPAANNRPLWVPSATDGFPLLRFDGVDDILSTSITGTNGLQRVTILAIFRFAEASGEDMPIILGNSLSTGDKRGLYRGGTTIGFSSYFRDILSSSYSADIGGIFHLWELWNTALSGTNHLFLGQDGINNSYTPNNGGTLSLTTNGFSVGSWITGISQYASQIDVREILVFSDSLSTPNLQKAEGYLMHQWNMQGLLPVNHPFKNKPPLVSD
jgi:hypothetical protein